MSDLAVVETNGHLSVPLSDRARAIYAAMDTAAVEVGRQLIAAKREHPGSFMDWVNSELPFGIDRAERLMAICRAFANADEDMRANLPSAYFALYQLSRIPTERVREGIETGEVRPDMTVRQAEALARDLRDPPDRPVAMPDPEPTPVRDIDHSVDIIAESLMCHPVARLSDDTVRRLRRWIS